MKNKSRKKKFDQNTKGEIETICKNLRTILEASALNPTEIVLAAFLVGAGKGTESREIAEFGKEFLNALNEEYEQIKHTYLQNQMPAQSTPQ